MALTGRLKLPPLKGVKYAPLLFLLLWSTLTASDGIISNPKVIVWGTDGSAAVERHYLPPQGIPIKFEIEGHPAAEVFITFDLPAAIYDATGSNELIRLSFYGTSATIADEGSGEIFYFDPTGPVAARISSLGTMSMTVEPFWWVLPGAKLDTIYAANVICSVKIVGRKKSATGNARYIFDLPLLHSIDSNGGSLSNLSVGNQSTIERPSLVNCSVIPEINGTETGNPLFVSISGFVGSKARIKFDLPAWLRDTLGGDSIPCSFSAGSAIELWSGEVWDPNIPHSYVIGPAGWIYIGLGITVDIPRILSNTGPFIGSVRCEVTDVRGDTLISTSTFRISPLTPTAIDEPTGLPGEVALLGN